MNATALRLLVLVLPGCEMESCAGNWPPPQPDASIPDAGRDAWMRTDAGRDGGRDVGVDADAPFGPTDPGWVHVGEVSDECEIDVATYPDRVFPGGTWVDCGAGCQRWESDEYVIYLGLSGGVPIIATGVDTPDGSADPRSYRVFSELSTGVALFALRDRYGAIAPNDEPYCLVHGEGVGAGSLAVTAEFVDFDAAGRFVERSWTRVLRHELADVTTSVRAVTYLDSFELTPSSIALSPGHLGILFARSVPALVGNDGSFVVPTFGIGDAIRNENLAMLGETDLFWEAWREPTVLVHSKDGAPPEVLRAVDGGDLRSFATDGTDFVWLEARGYDDATFTYATVDLWTATYEGGALVAPRRVRRIPSHDDGGTAGGYYVHPERNRADARYPDLVLYRLSDGARAQTEVSVDDVRAVLVWGDDLVVESWGQLYRIDPRALTFE